MDDQPEPSSPSEEAEPILTPVPPAPAESGNSGLDQKVAAGLATIFPLVGGIVFLIIEKKNAYVRFYAMQSLVFVVASIVLQIAAGILVIFLSFIPLIGTLARIIPSLLSLCLFAVWVVTIIKAFSGKEWEIPYLGKIARKLLKTSPI